MSTQPSRGRRASTSGRTLRLRVARAFLCAAPLIGGCVAPATEAPLLSATTSEQEFAQGENVRNGARHFLEGAYGLAQESFQKAVEAAPKNAAAWIGLAASYDQLRRFDLADRAYAQAETLGGANLQWLNNRAYSRLLRGDKAGARGYFERALALDPTNVVVLNNLALLSGDVRPSTGATR